MEQKRIKIISFILIFVLSVTLILLLVKDRKEEKEQEQYMQQLNEEAKVYEKEIAEIKQNISNMEKQIDVVDTSPQVSLCFQVENVEDIDWIENEFSSYRYPISLVLNMVDRDYEGSNIIARMAQSNMSMDLMFAGISALGEKPDVLQQLRDEAESNHVLMDSMWFLDSGEYTNENLEILSQNGYAGFTQLTDYAVNIKMGTTKDGLLYIEHVPVKAGENKVETSIQLAEQERKSLILSFDVVSIKADENYPTYISPVKDILQAHMDSGSLSVLSIGEVLVQKEAQDREMEEKRAVYEQYVEEQQNHINELQERADEVYSKRENK